MCHWGSVVLDDFHRLSTRAIQVALILVNTIPKTLDNHHVCSRTTLLAISTNIQLFLNPRLSPVLDRRDEQIAEHRKCGLERDTTRADRRSVDDVEGRAK